MKRLLIVFVILTASALAQKVLTPHPKHVASQNNTIICSPTLALDFGTVVIKASSVTISCIPNDPAKDTNGDYVMITGDGFSFQLPAHPTSAKDLYIENQ